VKYSFLSAEEGGRKTGPPAQGYRSDFKYAEDEVENRLWIIHPEFLDDSGNVILDKTIRVPNSGTAKMWILSEHLVSMHKSRIRIGQKGYFMEGPHKTAECEIIELVGLKQLQIE
jgi:hypothetical protein